MHAAPYDAENAGSPRRGTLPTLVLAVDGTVVEADDAACRLLSRRRVDVVGLTVDALVHTADHVAFKDALAAARDGAPGGDLRLRLQAADGSTAEVDLVWSLVRDVRGTPSSVNAVLLPVTAARHEHEDLVRTAARFRARFEQSSVPQGNLALDGRVVAVNDALCTLLGRPASELVGLTPGALNHPQDDGRGDREVGRLLAGEVDNVRYERVLVDAGERPLPVLVDVTLVRDAEGVPLEAAASVFDLRALRDVERRRDHQELLFLAVSQQASDVALVVDADGMLLFASAATQHVAGYEPHELVAQVGWDFVHPDDIAQAQQVFQRVVESGGTATFTARVRVADGSWRWFEQTVTNMLDTAIGGVVCSLTDVTDRVESERALRASETRYRTIADTAQEGIWAVRPDGTTLYANARMGEILGLPLDALYAGSAPSLTDPLGKAGIARRLASTDRRPESFEIGYQHPDGVERRLWIAASPLPDADGGHEGSLGMVSDITDVRRAEERLRLAALHDALTGLPNRTLLLDRLEQVLTRQQASGSPTVAAVLLLDLDDFKAVNESRGHGVGDSLLVSVAGRLLEVVRPIDTLARFGGDEFVVVAEGVDDAAAHELAEGLLAALRRPFEVDGQVVHVDASVGVALTPCSGSEDLLRFADAAMYQAKALGRGRVVRFDRALADEVQVRHELAVDLRTAVERDELRLHYQPVVDLTTGAVVGVEALSRWRHGRLGDVPPDRFVAIAEQTGLAVQLDTWAFRRALLETADLRRRGLLGADLVVGVNLSARTLMAPQLEESLAEALASCGCPAELVVLEITESAVMQDTARAVSVLQRLRERGFRVAVDDFGTGYSSLAYLRDLPITSIKIDRSFVAGIADDRDALAIVASIVDLARAIGVVAVAEGVETTEQATLLRRLGCAAAQGWLWSPALEPDGLERAGAPWAEGFAVGAPPPRVVHKQPDRWEVLAEHGGERLRELHEQGASLTTIAAALNGEGFRTPTGARWHRTTVARTIATQAYPDLTSRP